jgi:glycosyltransferase involved in cell wall biosynthesis/tetratricopeptide (TPR) repeat protein
VCFVEGFPGVGKTSVAQELLHASSYDLNVRVEAVESSATPLDDLWLEIASELDIQGEAVMAEAVEKGERLSDAFERLSAKRILVVIDDAERLFEPNQGRPLHSFERVLTRVARRPKCMIRVLLLTDQSLERTSWSEPYEIRTLFALETVGALELLNGLLSATGREREVPEHRRHDIVTWLAGNPRALRIFVGALAESALDELVGLEPEAWEARDRDVGPDILQRLEVALLGRIIERVDIPTQRLLQRLSAYRASFKLDALSRMAEPVPGTKNGRQTLTNLFLLDQNRGWYRLNSLVREFGLAQLRREPARLRSAHAAAGEHYARHFKGKQIVNATRLGQAFIESRYHLVQARKADDLHDIAQLFGRHLTTLFSRGGPLPKSPDALREEIVVLSALLADGGPKQLHGRLARLFVARNDAGDAERALVHSRQSLSLRAPIGTWLVYARLVSAIEGSSALVPAIRPALDADLPMLVQLYQSAGELLAGAGRVDEAIELLKEGIGRISPAQNLSLLYQTLSSAYARAGRHDEGATVLLEGAKRLGPANNGPRLLESSLLLLAALRSEERLQQLIETLDPRIWRTQLIFAEVVRLQLRGEWRSAAEVAHGAPVTTAPLLSQEAFSWLCAGESRNAKRAVDEITLSRLVKGVLWLQTFVELRNGDADAARANLERYLGRPLEPGESADESLLIELWEQSVSEPGPTAAHFFPMLPHQLTHLPSDVILLREMAVARSEDTPPSEPKRRTQRRQILCVASEWRSFNGGISTFSRKLAEALATEGHLIVCLVPDTTLEEVSAARGSGVLLCEAPRSPGVSGLARLASQPKLPASFEPELIVGHGRITGPAAKMLQDQWFPMAKRIHVVHTVPADIEWYKETDESTRPSTTGEQRETIELELASTANVVVAVGPLLYREAIDLVRRATPKPEVHRLMPGLDAWHEIVQPPETVRCLVLGRTEDFKLKGLDIAARAFGLLPSMPGLPQPLLVVRGSPPADAVRLRDRLREFAGAGARIHVRDYAADEYVLERDLARTSVVLLPSRSEGFGLTALEAIAAGVPVLVSGRSGIGEFLQEIPEAANTVVPIADDLDEDAAKWSTALDFILRDREAAFSRARRLRERLEPAMSWDDASVGLLSLPVLNSDPEPQGRKATVLRPP